MRDRCSDIEHGYFDLERHLYSNVLVYELLDDVVVVKQYHQLHEHVELDKYIDKHGHNDEHVELDKDQYGLGIRHCHLVVFVDLLIDVHCIGQRVIDVFVSAYILVRCDLFLFGDVLRDEYLQQHVFEQWVR